MILTLARFATKRICCYTNIHKMLKVLIRVSKPSSGLYKVWPVFLFIVGTTTFCTKSIL